MNIHAGSSVLARNLWPCLISLLIVMPLALIKGPLHWHGYSYFLFLPAVALAEILFGLGIGLFTLAATVVVATFFYIEPLHSFWFSSQQVPALALYTLSAFGVFGVCEGGRLLWKGGMDRWRNAGLSLRMAAGTPAEAPVKQRFESVDLWRGFVLCTIFINHMPGNIFEVLTSRNFGLSDSAEAFVFMSGVAMALAYGRKFDGGKEKEVSLSLFKRAVKLYGVHVLLSLAGIAIFGAGAIYWHAPDMMTMHGRDLFINDPNIFLAGTVTLGHQLGYFNILPMYIIMIAAVPPLLYLARIRIELMLAASALLYALARYYGWNLPSWPVPGTWFFNPLTWQFMMAIGIATGLMLKKGTLPRSAPLFVLSAVIVFAGAFVVTNGFGLSFGVRDAVYAWLDLDKTNLALPRLIHFLGVAYFIYSIGISPRLVAMPMLRPLLTMGRHSLLVFVLLSLTAAFGQVLFMTGHDALWVQLALVAGGITFFYAAARYTEVEKAAGGPVMVRG